MTTSALVSVIMPCFNCAQHLLQGVASVVRQTYGDFELIIVDDGSGDASAAIVRGITDARIRFIQQPNEGVSAARNTGLAAAQGEFIAFLDSDDTWEPEFIAETYGTLRSNPNAALAYCGWQNLGLPSARGQPFVPPDYETPEKIAALLADCPWPIHAALTRRSEIIQAGGFDRRFANGEDYLLWLEIACFRPIVRVPKVLAYYHFHGGVQASSNLWRASRSTWLVKNAFLTRHPEIEVKLGHKRVRDLVIGKLLEKGYEHYWRREMGPARGIFRLVMRAGYGSLTDWLRMLPAWLPLPLHQLLLRRRDG
jgi:glycosyltransferase involved in cell wall biosynthesis